MKVKIDINQLADNITEVLNSSKPKCAKENRVAISVGFNVLLSYLQEIAQRAVKIDDAVILSALLNIRVLLPDNAEEEKQIRQRAEKEKQNGTM